MHCILKIIAKSKTVMKSKTFFSTVEESDLLIGDKTVVKGYHTQECRVEKLDQPLKSANDARLGVGYYFWIEEDFAHNWGKIKKSQSGAYDIYTADLNIKKCLNTVFNEKHYLFFRIMIKEVIQQFKNKGISANLEEVNRFLCDNVWQAFEIKCIIYDDKPTNKPKKNLIYSEIPDLYYNKRIQLAIFDLEDISNFELYLIDQKPV